MASPDPPVALKGQCSIIHNNVLYVYSPNAFLTLPLSKNATWTQEENGISVTGALCVKGGLDGDGNNPALYVVGGTTNGSVSGYSGIQRYSIVQKKWETINPMSAVTANRLNHGATYLNASSAILLYGGSQSVDTGFSTETFLMLMYPPYRVQAYSSTAPAVKQPFLLPWTDDKAVLVGGGNGNQKVFTFHPDPGWVDLGVTLPVAPSDPSTTQVTIQALTDGTRILQTFYTAESPNRVTRNVLTNPGFVPASYGQTIGDSSPTTKSRFFQRQLFLGNYPTYNATNAPSETRTSASLASSGDLVALVGGDANSTVSVFNSTGNSWLSPEVLFGDIQNPLTASSSVSATSTPTASPTSAPTSMISSTSVKSNDNQSNGLAILGGVLGGICGLAAILIIFMLWLRSVKRRKRAEAAAKNKQNDSSYPDDKARGVSRDEDPTNTPLSQQAQPMGRSPVPSAAISEADSLAMFSGGKSSEKGSENSVQMHGGSKLNPNHGGNNSSVSFFKNNNKTPLQISKPMLPDLGDYQDRPSVDLGRATPSTAPVLPPVSVSSQQKADQRKTDEGWAKYFTEDRYEKPAQRDSQYTVSYEDDPRRSTSRPSTAKGGGTGFWPGAGVPTSNRSTKLPLRDSAGNPLNHATVATASPSLAVGPENLQTRNMSVAEPAKAKISSADSISTADHSSDDGYEDDDMDTYSEGRDSYHHNAWNPIGNTWSGPNQRPLRPPSVRVGATAFPPPTSHSVETTNTSISGGSSIPTFPMPAAAIGRADTTDQHVGTTMVERPPTSPYASKNPWAHARKSSNTVQYGIGSQKHDFFATPDTASSRTVSGKIPDNTDMSWLNLGTPAHIAGSPLPGSPYQGSPHTGEINDPA